MNLFSDWREFWTLDKLKEQFPGQHFHPGWNEGPTDTCLVLPCELKPKGFKYEVLVWNRRGIRAEIATLLGLPVYNQES